MESLKTFADIFRASINWSEMSNKKRAKIDLEVGETAVKALATKMAVESLEEKKATGEGLANFVMAVESAQAELSRLNGISYSVAAKHAEVIGIPLTTENFTTHVSKKNYDVATENLKMLAVIGLSAIVVAGFGYIVYKLLFAKNRKSAAAKELVKANKAVEKAANLFSSVDFSGLLDADREKLFLAMQEGLNPMVQACLTTDNFLTKGYAVRVASVAYNAELTQLEAYRFGADKNNWLIGPYLSVVDDVQHKVRELIALIKTIDASRRDVVAEKAAELNGALAVDEGKMRAMLGQWAKQNGCPTDSMMEAYASELIEVADGPTRMTPDDLIKRIEGNIEVPNENDYDKYNKSLDATTDLGKKLEDALKGIPRQQIDDDALDFLSAIVENFKMVLTDLDDMAYLVRSEAECLGNLYGYCKHAAKDYSEIVLKVLNEIDDQKVAKGIRDQLAKAVKELPTKRIAFESLEEQVASGVMEPIKWDSEGPFQGHADGLDVVAREAEEYLALPEYTQAGYRFDPRDGFEGSSLMAMESWSQGAKIAVGIAAAVGILGIGALIASTIIKRSSSSRESHASKEHLDTVKKSWERLEGETGSIYDELRDFELAVQGNQDYVNTHPMLREKMIELRERVARTKTMEINKDGQWVRIGRAIIDDLGGDAAFAMAVKLGEFNRHSVAKISLDIGDGAHVKGLNELFDNVIEAPIRALETGRSAEVVLEELDKYLDRKGNALYKEMTEGKWDIEAQIAQVDANWQPKGEFNSNSIEVISDPLDFLTMAMGANNLLLDMSDRIAAELGHFLVDERMLNRFRKVEEESKGSRDATASILRRIERFKMPFANFVRLLRRDQENIEKHLQFIDRYLKSMSKYGKDITAELANLRAIMKDILAEVNA